MKIGPYIVTELKATAIHAYLPCVLRTFWSFLPLHHERHAYGKRQADSSCHCLQVSCLTQSSQLRASLSICSSAGVSIRNSASVITISNQNLVRRPARRHGPATVAIDIPSHDFRRANNTSTYKLLLSPLRDSKLPVKTSDFLGRPFPLLIFRMFVGRSCQIMDGRFYLPVAQ